MSELVPAPIEALLARLYAETRANDAAFTLPRSKWFVPSADGPDLSARFHGRRVGNPSGPAAGPHTQMAQNLLLSYLAGGRVLELKTVQVNDRLTIPRPCIDMTTVGYNVEWSQELLVEQSAREYVAGMMLIEVLRRNARFAGTGWQGIAGDVLFDMSVGYDLAGIRGAKIQRFLDTMRDASTVIDALRSRIPAEFALARDIDYPKKVSSTLTLSTFHGCPSNEIERICEFLIGERDLDVIVKMNPPMLGKDRLEHLLHGVMGYTELTVNPSAYTSGLQWDEAVQLVDRLSRLAQQRGRRFGCKFSNTLEVVNHRTFFTPDNKVQYLSGQPLHVLAMTLAAEFRQAIGADVPISFSAGIDKQNFASAVASGFVPASVCTDLLRPGGYGRLPAYMATLASAMKTVGATTIDDYILDVLGQRSAAQAQAANAGVPDDREAMVVRASLLNNVILAERTRQDDRYFAGRNRKPPNRVNAQLRTFDCLTCDKCMPVCPNAANFTYPTDAINVECHDWLIDPSGKLSLDPAAKRFVIAKQMQIANFGDFCNECGNCDTFCPEYGGPYIRKPKFFGSLESWQRAAPQDGFVVTRQADGETIHGRMHGLEVHFMRPAAGQCRFNDDIVSIELNVDTLEPLACTLLVPIAVPHRVDIFVVHTLRHLLAGVMDRSQIHSVNAS
ncbi:MAG: hypothetical protein QM770_12140 [Tepidisphaeraceae bacterium]